MRAEKAASARARAGRCRAAPTDDVPGATAAAGAVAITEDEAKKSKEAGEGTLRQHTDGIFFCVEITRSRGGGRAARRSPT